MNSIGSGSTWPTRLGTVLVAAAAAMLGLATPGPARAAPFGSPSAQATPAVHTWVKHSVLTAEFGIPHPAGVAYDASTAMLVVTGANTAAVPSVLRTTPGGHRVGIAALPTASIAAPGAVAIDPATGSLLTPAPNGSLTALPPAAPSRAATRSTHNGLPARPSSLAVDGTGRHLWVFDRAAQQVTVLSLGTDDSATPAGSLPLAATGGAVSAVAYNAADGLLYVAVPSRSAVYGLDGAGRVHRVYDVGDVPLARVQSMVFAPSADPTDAPATTDLYLADTGAKGAYGGIIELALTPATVVAATSTASVVATTPTSAWTPPAPDPSGVTYLPASDQLLVADSEVDEMTLFTNVNLWTTSRAGVVARTGVTTGWSNEPTGISYDSRTGKLYASDDDRQKVFTVAPGADGVLGTSDDATTSFSALKAGSTDPEDVAINTDSGDLYIVDGIGSEVYHISPGLNGRFDGVAPTGDDAADHFDVGIFGAGDPEGIVYSPTTHDLYIVDAPSHRIYELTTTGDLVNSIDISVAGGLAEASITVAPSTIGTGTSFFVTDRRIDNDSHPNENDGRLYELMANLPSGGNLPPKVLAGPDETLAYGQAAPLAATVTDDGLPEPAALTTTWSTVAGPGTVTFADPHAADTTARFSSPGTYTLRVIASDGQLTSLDDLVVRVYGPTENFVRNPGFETGVTGWSTGGSTTGAGVTLTRVSPGHTGSSAAAITNPGTATVRIALTDSPNWVTTTTTVAARYTATLWARSDTPGKQLELALREYAGTTLVNSARATATLGSAWQQISVTYTPASPGTSTLDLTASNYGAAAGTSFVVDDVSITVGEQAAGLAGVGPTATSSPLQPVGPTPVRSHPFGAGVIRRA